MTVKTTPPRFGQKGFTLIEIVMVLVLLGIMAAVAVPKYFDLQELAEKRVAETVTQELQARLNADFAERILEGKMSCDDYIGNLTGIAADVVAELNAKSKATVQIVGESSDGLTVPIQISLTGNKDYVAKDYKYKGELVSPVCGLDSKN